MSSNLSPVYVYQGLGSTASVCVEKTQTSLSKYGIDSSRVIVVDVHYLKRELNSKDNAALILPGGQTISYALDLEPLVDSIKKAVTDGWSCLAICAGGNYISNKLSVDLPGEVNWPNFADHFETKFLDLLPIEAKAPAYPIVKSAEANRANFNGRMITIHSIISDSNMEVYWNEGSTFHKLHEAEHLQLEATYTDIEGSPACAYSGKYGKGVVVASAVHPEMTEDDQPLHPLMERFFDLTVSK